MVVLVLKVKTAKIFFNSFFLDERNLPSSIKVDSVELYICNPDRHIYKFIKTFSMDIQDNIYSPSLNEAGIDRHLGCGIRGLSMWYIRLGSTRYNQTFG